MLRTQGGKDERIETAGIKTKLEKYSSQSKRRIQLSRAQPAWLGPLWGQGLRPYPQTPKPGKEKTFKYVL